MVEDIIADMGNIKDALYKAGIEQTRLFQELAEYHTLLTESELLLERTEQARIIVNKVANDIQKGLEYHITNIVTMALSAVFEEPYEFKAEFVTKRNQTEIDMFFVKNSNQCEPMHSTGGGVLDIASLALRMAVWSLKQTRAIQILDEPCKFLSRDMQEKASEMLKMLSTTLGIQMIIISHIPEIISSADRVYTVEQKSGVSKVSKIGGEHGGI